MTVCCLPDGSDTRYTRWTYDRTYDRTVITDTAPGKIVSGSGMRLLAHTLNNSDSHILAGGALDVTADALNNHETQGILTYTDSGESQYFWYHNSKYSIHTCSDSPVAFSRDPVSTSIGLGTVKFAANQEGAASGTQIGSAPSLALPGNSLFTASPDVTAGYLVETNPRFTDYRNWISSDYMLAQLGIDPAAMMKRLGDGFYEQRLVQEQVAQLTGRRFLEGYASNEQQYQDLLANGVTVAQAWDLRPGVALTDTQIARLTSDIVWLVEKEVTLPNGETTRALVPQLYLMPREGDLTGAGALIAGNTLNLKLSGNLANQGTVAGREVVAITADNISNTGGRITGETVGLLAEADINNTGGIIDAVNRLEATAGGNIHVASTTVESQDGTRTDIDRVAGLYITGNADGVMLAHAGRDMTISGAVVSNNSEGGMTVLTAGNDINLGTVATQESASFKASGIRRQESSETETGSTLAAKGEVQLVAGHDLTAKGAAIATEKGDITLAAGNNINLTTATQTATVHEDMKRGKKSGFSNGDYALESGTAIQSGEGSIKMLAGHDVNARGAYVASGQAAVNVAAGNDVNLTASADHVFQDKYFRVKKKGVLSKKTTTTYDVAETLTSQGSVISGNTTEILAGNDVNIQGSHAVSDYGTGIYAGHDIHIAAATDSAYENHYKKVKKSGVMGGGGLGVTIGSQAQSNDNKNWTQYASASTAGAVHGDINLIAGNHYTQTGSHIQAQEGDINIKAGKVDITEARESNYNVNVYKFKQSGLSVSVTNPVISAVQTTAEMKRLSRQTDDSRMKTMAAAATALSAYDAYGSVRENPSTAGGINISASLGTSKSSSTTITSNQTGSGSTVTAGNHINIEASGAGEKADLTIRGSHVAAGNDVMLKADNNINLLASANTQVQHGKNSSSGASFGVNLSFGEQTGLSFQAGVSKGKGKSEGTDLAWQNSHVTAGNQLAMQSGRDTNLIGAAAGGNQVTADVGGNLNMASLQDTSVYHAEQKGGGLSASLCVPPLCSGISSVGVSASRSNAKGDYASVVEQSGILSGDDGFQIVTRGNTRLEGAVIASTDKAIQDGKNILSTGTLVTADMHNHAEAHAKSDGIALDSSMFSSKYQAAKGLVNNAVNNGEASGASSGETRSAVSEGTVIITNEESQLALTGTTAGQTIAGLNRDTAHAHQAAEKQDVHELEQQAQAIQAIKVAVTREAIKFTDDAYRKKFLNKAQVYAVERDAEGKAKRDADGNVIAHPLSEEEKKALKPGKSGQVQVATNGIFNDLNSAADYAAQHAENKDEPLYLVYFPQAKTGLSELMIAGYQYFMENDFTGLTNATQEVKDLMGKYGNDGLLLSGHSRGGMTIGNALESMGNEPRIKDNMTNAKINLYGSAYNADKALSYMTYLQGTGRNEKDLPVTSTVHFADFVGTVIGGNAPTGGTLPTRQDGEPISQAQEAFNILFGSVTAHSCYGSGKAGCEAYWNNSPSAKP